MNPNNRSVTLFSSTARTATLNSDVQANHTWRGVHIIIDVTSITSSPSVVPTIQGKDNASGKFYDLLVGVAITATGTTVLKLYPGITASANISASDLLPNFWRVRMVHANADSITYSVGAGVIV